MAYIRLEKVTKRFGAVIAVNDLTLGIEKGECVAMLGPSGCGKTTTLRMVAGFEDLDEGEIHVGERLLSSRRRNYYLPPEKRNFGMVFQAFAVWPHLSVYENVAFPLRVRQLERAEIERRTREALTHTNLLADAAKSPDELSGGGKQRVALARALAIHPDVMLLDEPLSSLDPHLREEMRFEIKDLQRTLRLLDPLRHPRPVRGDGAVRPHPGDEPGGRAAGRHPARGLPAAGQPLRVRVHRAVELPGGPAATARRPAPAGLPPPPVELTAAGRAVLASRPTEIDFTIEGGVRAVVTRCAYLGEIIDYRVDVGGQEVRVQKSRRTAGPRAGEACGLIFTRPTWYEAPTD